MAVRSGDSDECNSSPSKAPISSLKSSSACWCWSASVVRARRAICTFDNSPSQQNHRGSRSTPCILNVLKAEIYFITTQVSLRFYSWRRLHAELWFCHWSQTHRHRVVHLLACVHLQWYHGRCSSRKLWTLILSATRASLFMPYKFPALKQTFQMKPQKK